MTDVARRNGVVRQTVHHWLRRYAANGLAGLADGSSKPATARRSRTSSPRRRLLVLEEAGTAIPDAAAGEVAEAMLALG